MPIEAAIAQHKFCYGNDAHRRGMAPPPHVPALGTFPAPLPSYFERAFGCDCSGRPSAQDWVAALTAASTLLRPCPLDPAHVYPETAGTCPWCAIEQAAGVVLFSRAARPIEKPDGRLLQLFRVIADIQAPGLQPPVALESLPTPAASAAACQAGDRVRKLKQFKRWALVSFFASLALVVVSTSSGLMLWVVAAAAVTIGAEVGHGILVSRFDRAATEASQAYEKALGQYEALRVRGVPAAGALLERQRQLQVVTRAWHRLPQQHVQGIKRLERRQAQEDVKIRLQSSQIKHAKVTGLNRALVSYLASFGIVTAADVTQTRLCSGPAIGRDVTDRLLQWRKSLERQVLAGARPLDARRLQACDEGTERRRRDLERQLVSGVDELRAFHSKVDIENAIAVGNLTRAAEAVLQAKCDLHQLMREL